MRQNTLLLLELYRLHGIETTGEEFVFANREFDDFVLKAVRDVYRRHACDINTVGG